MSKQYACVCWGLLLALLACESGVASPTAPVGGAGEGGGVAAPGGSPAVAEAGRAAGVAGISGAPSAGRSGNAAIGNIGGSPAGGAGLGAGSSAAAGSSGSAAGGGAGSASAPDGGVPDAAVAGGGAMPSAGCAKAAARPAGGAVTQADRIYTFPAAYDGKTPQPLLLALHAAGNPNTQLQNLTKGSRLETDFVRVFPKSAGSAWVYDTDIGKLNAVLDDVLANHCIDTRRMFATGHSSGAQMVVQMLCKGEKRFAGVAPVAASKYCAKLSPVPVMYIQGKMDAQRGGGNGADVADVFTASNMCTMMIAPTPGVPSCTSTFDRKPVTAGCVTYQGCAAPSVWCSHDDNGYNNTDGRQHGWPCFASAAIAEFFLGLPAD